MRTMLVTLILLWFAVPAAAQPAPDAPGRRGWLGISFDAARQRAGELLVDEVADDSPAERAGVEAGDRIVRWNGSADVLEALRAQRLEAGDTVRLRVDRNGAEQVLTLVAEPRRMLVERMGRDGEVIVLRPGEVARRLQERQGELMESMDSLHARLRLMLRDSLGPRLERLERGLPRIRIETGDGDDTFLFREGLGFALAGGRMGIAGAAVTDVTPGLGSYFGTETGALVLRVAPDTPAAEAGLQEGDVIVRANGEAIESVADLREAIGPPARGRFRLGVGDDRPVEERRAAREDVPLEIIRQGHRYSLTLPG